MNSDLFINSDVIATLIAFVLGTIVTWLLQFFNERRQKAELRYSKTTEQTFALLKKEVKDDLAIIYKGNPVESLSYFRLEIANTGRKAIRKQYFTCSFPEEASILKEPDVTPSSPEVGPIKSVALIQSNNQNSPDVMSRYEIEKIGVGDTIKIEFFVTKNPSSTFRVDFGANDEQDVVFAEGATLRPITLEIHLWKIIIGLLGFFIIKEVFAFRDLLIDVPLLGTSINFEGLGAILGLPFIILFVVPSLRPIVTAFAEKLQGTGKTGVTQSYIVVQGNTYNSNLAVSPGSSVSQTHETQNYPQTPETNG